MLKLATTIKNPGEPAADSRYNSPTELRNLGFDARVLFETTGLSGVSSPNIIQDPELRRWVQNTIDNVSRSIEEAAAAGLGVYLFYDMLVLPRDLVERNVSALTCKNRPTVLCPASDLTFRHAFDALAALLDRWPTIDGIVLRFGDTDAARLPHLVGNDIYSPHCPRCSQFGRADRIVSVLEQAYDLVVNQRGKRLIARAWNVRPNGMHDSAELTKRIVDRLPGNADDDRFMLSFKFTQTDFWRYQPWNEASLVCGNRPIIYELQCQREFEGKGGVPNWQVPLWSSGYPETAEKSKAHGLADAASKINLAGLFAWVRGGGWGGPFVRNESWIDANVFAVPKLAANLSADPADIARQWVRERLGLEEPESVDILVGILERSPEAVRQAFYIEPFARNKVDAWHPSADWVSDDLLDASAAWRMVQRLPEHQLDEAVAEKNRAAQLIAADRQQLQLLVHDRTHPELDKLLNTLLYAESFYEALRDLLAGLVAYRRYQKTPGPGTADLARRKLFDAQAHWNHHAQRHGSAPGTATPFRETRFWDLTQDILAQIG